MSPREKRKGEKEEKERDPVGAKNGTDHRNRSVPIFAYSGQRAFASKRIALLNVRSRTGALWNDSMGKLRDDTPKRHPGSILARISVFREKWDRP